MLGNRIHVSYKLERLLARTIDSILWSHTVTPIVSDIWNGSDYTPIALSIVQARFIGLVHFSVGFIVTYASFVIAYAT